MARFDRRCGRSCACKTHTREGVLLAKAREMRSEAPVIVIAAFGSVEQAVEMVKRLRQWCLAP
jgi:hypothetical protein